MGRIERDVRHATSSNDDWDIVSEFWDAMLANRSYWQNQINSMPDRLAMVIETGGDMTKY